MRTLLLLFLILLLSVSTVFSSQFGRMSGTVLNESGTPIQAASVRLDGTRVGMGTDVDGHFQLAAIVPGRYTVVISSVGYRTQQIVDVEIVSGRTTHLSVHLEPETINLSPVTLTFKKPPVNLDETHERVSVLQETIAELPVRRSDHMVQYQPGVILGPGGDVHVRGGRSGELVYFVDGLEVKDPIGGKRAANIGREGMQEAQFLTGTFDPEYGSSMSGVVNIVSREGGDRYHGSLEWESQQLNSSPYQDDLISGYDSRTVLDNQDPWIPAQGRFSGTLSGPVPGLVPITFFLHGVHEAETKPEAFGDKWVRRITGKLACPIDGGKLALSFGFRGRDDQPYNHRWKYISQQYHRRWERNNRASLTWNQSLNPNLFYDLTAGVYHRTYDVRVFKSWGEYVAAGWQAPSDRYFHDDDDWSNTWSESVATSWIGSGKLNWYRSEQQQLSVGGDVRVEQVKLTDIELTGVGWNDKMIGNVSRFDETPFELAVWGQDRVELGRWIFNGGLRLDMVEVGTTGWTDPSDPQSSSANMDSKWQLSPRVGVAYRMGEASSIHAGYGHFFQMPNYQEMFINAAAFGKDPAQTFGIIGNPDLDPQRTVAWELGLKHALTEQVGFSVTGYFKDIRDLVSERTIFDPDGNNLVSYQNVAEARTYGVEFSLHKTYGDFWSLDANYTLSWAEAIAAGGNDVRLPWDRRHSVNSVFAWQAGRDSYPRLFGGATLQGLSVGLLTTVASGLPYSPSGYNSDTEITDAFVRIDIRVAKSFWWNALEITPFVTVDNLFDRRNPVEAASESSFQHNYFPDPYTNMSISDPDPAYWDIPRIVRAGVLVSY